MRLTLRLLGKRPGFAALILLTLALGIGAPTAIFSVLHAVLLRPLPYPDAGRVLRFQLSSQSPRGAATFDALPVATAFEWQRTSTSLAAVSVFNDRSLTLTTADGPFRLAGAAVSPNLFQLLRVDAEHGQTFDPEATDERQLVLSRRTWQQYFGGDTRLIGSPVAIDGQAFRVVGVMPEDFQFPSAETAFWVPLLLQPDAGRGMMLPAIARLRADATLAEAVTEGRQFFRGGTDPRTDFTLHARTLQDHLVGNTRRVLWVLMASVSLVTVIATTNIAILLLVRGAARTREFAIRLAIGAPRARLVRQLFAEAITIAALGGVAGTLLAAGLLRVLLHTAPADIPRLQEAALDGTVLAFAVALTGATCLVFALLSAGRSIRFDPLRALGAASTESRVFSGGGRRRRLNALASAELAITLVLLVGAGLLLRSFIAMVLIDHGFDAKGAIAMQVTLPAARYPNAADRMAFLDQLLDRVRRLDAANVAGVAITMPNRAPTARFAYDPVSLPVVEDPLTLKVAEVRTVSDGFFEAMGMRVRAGRTFRPEDRDGAEPVMVISDKLARVHFGDQDPIGRLLYSHSGTRQVIGVVEDVRPLGPTNDPGHAAYLPLRQDPGVFRWFASVTLVIRGPHLAETEKGPASLMPSRDNRAGLAASLRTIVLSMDAEMPLFNVRTLDAELSRVVAAPRFSAAVLMIFGGIALVLATIGVYGVMAFAAAQRTQEIAVRVALGATRAQVLRLVIRDGVIVVATGLLIGLIAAVWLAQSLAGLLYDVQPADPIALATVAAILSSVALFAAYLPARRATRVNAVDALRAE
jgi:putative ABC transport system permease protein